MWKKILKICSFYRCMELRLAVLLVLLLLVLLHLSKRSPMISKYSKKNMPVIYKVVRSLAHWCRKLPRCQLSLQQEISWKNCKLVMCLEPVIELKLQGHQLTLNVWKGFSAQRGLGHFLSWGDAIGCHIVRPIQLKMLNNC